MDKKHLYQSGRIHRGVHSDKAPVILKKLRTITDTYEEIRSELEGHVDFVDMNPPGYANVSSKCLTANLRTPEGRIYTVIITERVRGR